jgi:hypothetical protein
MLTHRAAECVQQSCRRARSAARSVCRTTRATDRRPSCHLPVVLLVQVGGLARFKIASASIITPLGHSCLHRCIPLFLTVACQRPSRRSICWRIQKSCVDEGNMSTRRRPHDGDQGRPDVGPNRSVLIRSGACPEAVRSIRRAPAENQPVSITLMNVSIAVNLPIRSMPPRTVIVRPTGRPVEDRDYRFQGISAAAFGSIVTSSACGPHDR